MKAAEAEKQSLKIGIAGCGAIGSRLAAAIDGGCCPGLVLEAVAAGHWESAQKLCAALSGRAAACRMEEMAERCDVVVEAASCRAMPGIAKTAFAAGKDVVSLSSGALAMEKELPAMAEKAGCRLYFPSGALAGLDAVLALRESGLREVSLTTTKKPASLAGAPWLEKHPVALEALSHAETIFEGFADEAIRFFPANANAAVTLSFAGLGLGRTRVRIVADPGASFTVQEVRACGEAGEVYAVTKSSPCPDNPRTGMLAVNSALALLRTLSAHCLAGTGI